MSAALYGLIPAAGRGLRLGADLPKQYLPLLGEAMLVHTLRGLLAHAEIKIAFVVLDAEDTHFAAMDLSEFGERAVPLYCGGPTRRDSVRNGLIAMQEIVEPDDWVLVHDAARPCLGLEELTRLIESARQDAAGAILAMPLADTLKRADGAGHIQATEPRENLWLAQTPQMFRHGLLLRALDAAPAATDEASAVEALGLKPRLVQGASRNLKVTHSGDAAIAAALLAEMHKGKK